MTCIFFGHKDTTEEIQPKLEREIIKLIEKHNVTTFYVGNQGNFDRTVLYTLDKLKISYPHIDYAVVLAYMPIYSNVQLPTQTVYPDGLENTPPKFAIDKRNRWMVQKCDFAITFVTHTFGGAAKYKDICIKKRKTVIELSDIESV